MRDDLTRYFVVDGFGHPVTVSPHKLKTTAAKLASHHNGPETDNVKGIPQCRPYRVVKLVPAPPAPEATE